MPQALVPLIVPLITAIGVPAAAAGFVATGLAYGAFIGASYLLTTLLAPDAPNAPPVPKPEDGRYNLKQSVPSPWIRLGRSQSGGHYTALLEYNGVAYHVICVAVHRIKGFLKFRLHDEDVTLNGSGVVTSPTHFRSQVSILYRRGLDTETAYAPMVTAFSGDDVWTNDHRGDGLASFMMSAATVSAKDHQKVYPFQMPVPTCAVEGHDRIYDPRTETYGYTENIALFRLWHLTSPYGGKLKLADVYLPDWINAANVCDEDITNRDGDEEPRYHGGIRFPANSNPVEVGRSMDQAGELVVYERADGLVGVHAGEMVTPTVSLRTKDLKSVVFQANRKLATNVLAVRGQWTNPETEYTTNDAAIYGDPYVDDGTERSKTIANPMVQRHNHMQRMQKLAYIRARAQRVSIIAEFDAAEGVKYSRFVTVDHPPKLSSARIEIIGRPKVSLKNMTVSFEGIVVPPTLYAFDADTEEGEPGSSIIPAPATTLAAPSGFSVTIGTEEIGGGDTAAYGAASWVVANSDFLYELEWEPSSGGTKQSVLSDAGDSSIRTGYLADGVEYNFRLRVWAGISSSDWTADFPLTATADPTPPGVVTGASAIGGAGEVVLSWTSPNSANYTGTKMYRNTVNDFGTAVTVDPPEYGAPNSADSRTDTGLAAGSYYYWLVAFNGSGVESTEVATGLATVT